MAFIRNHGLLLLSAVLARMPVTVSGAGDACVTAFKAIQDAEQFGMSGPCSINSTYSVELLETEACPAECQSLYDAVLGNCTPGIDLYYEDEEYSYLYQEAVLYHDQGSKWKSCNYGYEPTACDEAFGDLNVALFSGVDWFASSPRSVPAACAVNDGAAADEPCSSDCKVYIDAVVQACDANPDAMFAPSSFYFLEENHQRIAWESPRAVQFREINSPPISQSCWMYYTDSAAAVNPKFGTDDSIPPFGSEACQRESRSINRFELGDILFAVLDDKTFSPGCLDDDVSTDCDISFSDAELSDYQAACEKMGGQILKFNASTSCVEEGDSIGDSFYSNFPVCVGKSCDGNEVCEVVAEQEAKSLYGDSCTATTSCRESSSARHGRVLGSSTSVVGVVVLFWAVLI